MVVGVDEASWHRAVLQAAGFRRHQQLSFLTLPCPAPHHPATHRPPAPLPQVRCLVDYPGEKLPSVTGGELEKYLLDNVAPQVGGGGSRLHWPRLCCRRWISCAAGG